MDGRTKEILEANHKPMWTGNMEKPCEGCTVISEGYEAGRKERDALRAEVEVMRRALEWVLRKTVDSMDCPPEFRGDAVCDGPSNSECVKCVSQWAISEARKGEG